MADGPGPRTGPTPLPSSTRLVVRAVAFLWGLQFAFLSPALALLLVSVFGASTGQVSLVLAIYNAACLLSSWAIPRWADRHVDYVRPMIACAVLTVALSAVLEATHALPLAVVGLVLLGAPAAVGTPLLFGYVRHSGAAPSEVVTTRAVFSMAWVAGPPTASAIISTAGGHALVLGIGVVGATNIIATTTLLRAPKAHADLDGSDEPAEPAPRPARSLLVGLLAVFALLQAGNSASVAITTLFVKDKLGLSPLWGGVALGVAAGLEVPVLFLLGSRHRRLGDLTLLSLAGGLGIAYYVLMATAESGVTVVAIQVLNAGFYAVVAGVGLTLFQSILPGPGAAAGLLSSAQRTGSLLAGPLVGIGSLAPGGLRAVFAAAAALTAISLVLLRVIAPAAPRARP